MTKNELRAWYQTRYPKDVNASYDTMRQAYTMFGPKTSTGTITGTVTPTVTPTTTGTGVTTTTVTPVTSGTVTGAGTPGVTGTASSLGTSITDAGTKLKGWLGNNLAWDKSKGLTVLGKDLGKSANKLSALMYAAQAVNNASNISNSRSDADELVSDILRSSTSNPMASDLLTSEQLAMLNKLKRGSYGTEASLTDFDLMGLLGGAGKGAISGGVFGGVPGAIIGAIGGGVNSHLENTTQNQDRINAELEGLLQALTDAESQYQAMRRPNLTGLGLQSRYQNMYM